MTEETAIDSEFLGKEGANVTGFSRMEAAYGSGDGDEEAIAAVASSANAEVGTIFEQIYRPWNGTLNTRWVRNWSILRHHIYGMFSKGHRPWGWPVRISLLILLLGSMNDLFLSFLGNATGVEELSRLFSPSRENLYAHVLGFFPRNVFCFPIAAALLVGGMISEDRKNGTSAIYFSRPVNRTDYTVMKFVSVAILLSILIVGTLAIYYIGDLVLSGEGWAYVLDTFPLFFAAGVAGFFLVFTYSSIGLALSSVSRGKFFPAIALLGIILGTKFIAFLISQLYDDSIVYLLSPYDCIAHLGQKMMGVSSTYEHPYTWSLVAIIIMNSISLYVLTARVSSMEVTRE
ncbi:MAG TPA: ABC transporter permease subunit [Candidatus Poseidoniaceae archaeon]|jgi:ABC-type transport system involved in multi-copper enzyme maturation permease subunit|nr:ABC transporter permease subunit [Candidatus Poseidoniaceae archaeon]